MIDLAAQPMPDRMIFSPNEVQTLLGIGHAEFYREVNRHNLTIFKVGRATKVDRAEVLRWIESKKAASAQTGQDIGEAS